MTLFRRRFTHQGAPPGSLAISDSLVEPKVSLVSFDARHCSEVEGAAVSELPIQREGELVSWVDVRGLGDGRIVQEIGERFGLHALAISDVMNVGQRPKVDRYDDVHFVVARMVMLGGDGRLHWEQVSLFLGPFWVVTFQETHDDCLDPLRELIRVGHTKVRTSGADYLACMVIDGIVDGYFPVLETYGERLEDFEELILEDHHPDVLEDLYLTKRDLAGFRRATWPLREALTSFMRAEEGPMSKSALLHLRDTLDHTMQVVDVNESYRELAASLVDVHLSMVGQRTNEIMKVLAVVSTIFIPLTFVAGIYGMNFDTSSPHNMPELGWPLGYYFFWGLCALITCFLLYIFYRLGWLRRWN